uniref:Protein kinase domain-containing protein n=1 Tax=Glossina morsitans morsitans TaxID=37546 RepID=A0A1B0FE26_GLOMM
MDTIYRDIKLENILLDSEGHILLTDFGLSKRFSSHPEHRAYTVCGTPEYMAPEIIRGGGYGYAVDWWSIGALTCELLTNTSPFPAEEENNSPSDILRRIDEMDPVLPPTLDETTRDFLLKMLNKDPQKRLSEHVKKHAFFYGIDWTDLKNKNQEAPFKPILHDGDDTQNFSEEFTNQPLLDSPAEVLHNANSLFRSYSYVAPQHLCGRLATKHLATFPVAYLNKPISDPPSAPETLLLERLISSGSFGTCCTAICNNQTYAVKIIPDSKYRPSEVDALISCAHDDHKSIAQYVATYRKGSDIWLVQEYVPGDEVAERIANREYNFDEVKCRAIFKQLIDAVKHIHEKRFIHGDLKLENIIFTDDETDQIKLVDFGAARQVYSMQTSSKHLLLLLSNIYYNIPHYIFSYTTNRSMWNDVPRYTIDYAPPEALQHAEYATYSASFDIWCLGAILYTMFMGHTPFRRERAERCVDAATLKQRILHDEIFTCADRWNEASSELRNLIGSCLEKDITKRATMQEILLHPWLKINARQANSNLSRAFDINEDFLGYENSKNKRARKRVYLVLLALNQRTKEVFNINARSSEQYA